MSDLLMKTPFGSHLYGMATENSDTDYLAVRLHNPVQMALGLYKKEEQFTTGSNDSKNTAEDVDQSTYDYLHFLKELSRGELKAVDTVFCDNQMQFTSDTFEHLRANRHRFLTKQMKGFVGYVKKQVWRYGVKGSTLGDLRVVRKVLENHPNKRLKDVLPILAKQNLENVEVGADYMKAKGKTYMYSEKTTELAKIFAKFESEYGHRSDSAEKAGGVDWKAVAHAFRCMYQFELMVKDGGFKYPLSQNEFLMQVKRGELPFSEVQPLLETQFEKVKTLFEESDLPERPEVGLVEKFFVMAVESHYTLTKK